MSDSASDSIYQALAAIRLIDPHTHINPHTPASRTLADLLGYHYYTELAHSAGMPRAEMEEAGLPPRELVRRLVAHLSPIENTAQYRWLVEICRKFFSFQGDRIDLSNWEQVYESAEQRMSMAQWPQMVLDQSNVEAVFLTNDFDDPLSGFDTQTYVPCLRTDDLVFHLAKPATRQRLAACAEIELDGSLSSLRRSLAQRFEHFVGKGARACAISLPPTFEAAPVSDGRAATAWDQLLRRGPQADPAHHAAMSRRVFWTLAELCDEYHLPFDLMIGVNRGVYRDGVYQGQDLYDSRVSLIQYRELFNAFPEVKFPISVLASVTNQELVSYSWIFPNVFSNGHWWYSNTPSFIARDAAARLEAIPQTKQIAYYSDAYKLEFVWPKFDMYRRVLARILADHFVTACGWSEERAVELGQRVLRDNVDAVFPPRSQPAERPCFDPQVETWDDVGRIKISAELPTAAAGTSAALAAGAIGMVEVEPAPASPQTSPPTPLTPGEPSWEEFIESDQPPSQRQLAASDSAAEHERVPSQDPYSTIESSFFSLPTPLDPLPSSDEIQAVEVADVELRDPSADARAVDAAAIDLEAELEPLDVGDLFGPDEVEAAPSEQIRPLRGEQSFEPDEDSLQLQPHPLTGELTLPVPEADQTLWLDVDAESDPLATLELAPPPVRPPALEPLDLEPLDLEPTADEPLDDEPPSFQTLELDAEQMPDEGSDR